MQCEEALAGWVCYCRLLLVVVCAWSAASMFPKNLDELQARVQELPGKVMTTVTDAKEKCSLQ